MKDDTLQSDTPDNEALALDMNRVLLPVAGARCGGVARAVLYVGLLASEATCINENTGLFPHEDSWPETPYARYQDTREQICMVTVLN